MGVVDATGGVVDESVVVTGGGIGVVRRAERHACHFGAECIGKCNPYE